MRRRLPWLVLLGAVIQVTVLYHSASVSATPAQGFAATTLAMGRLAEIDVIPSNFKPEGHKPINWRSWQKTKGPSDLYVQSNVWQPGGSTGWHTHPGHSLIIVTDGTVTSYDAHDPDCKPHVYTRGMGFVDPGGGHVHILRNEGDVVAKTIAIQLIPEAAVRWIDAQDPGNCHF